MNNENKDLKTPPIKPGNQQFDPKKDQKDIGTTRHDDQKDVKPNEVPMNKTEKTSPVSDRL